MEGGWRGAHGLKEGKVAMMMPGLCLSNPVQTEDFPKKDNSE